MEKSSRVFLVHFFKKFKYLDFCLPELESLAEINGIHAKDLYNNKTPKQNFDIKDNPCIYVNLPSEEVAKNIVKRSILIKEIIDVIGHSTVSTEHLISNLDKQHL